MNPTNKSRDAPTSTGMVSHDRPMCETLGTRGTVSKLYCYLLTGSPIATRIALADRNFRCLWDTVKQDKYNSTQILQYEA